MSVDVDTTELDGLVHDLGAAGPKVMRASSESMTRVARELLTNAQRDVPVDEGDLHDSLQIRGGKDYRDVFTDSRYGAFVEFGTVDTPPQPYLWSNARKAEADLYDAIERDSDPLA